MNKLEKIMTEENFTEGRMDITIKINGFPNGVETIENNWKQFYIHADGKEIEIIVRPKVFKKLEKAQEDYPEWVAAIAGKMGKLTEKGFVLEYPTIQTFEKKPKEKKEEKKEENAT
jgi:hypothetical protein